MIVTTMRNFKMASKVIQKDSKSSMILPGLLAYTQSLHQTFHHLRFQQQPGQLEPYSPEVEHFCIGSFLHVSSMFADITKWTLLTQDNFWNILLLLLVRPLALLTHQCSIRTVLHVRLEFLLHLF